MFTYSLCLYIFYCTICENIYIIDNNYIHLIKFNLEIYKKVICSIVQCSTKSKCLFMKVAINQI